MAARCISCGAPIIWIKTPKGSYIPANEGLVPYIKAPAGKDSVVTQKGEVIRCHIQEEADEQTSGMARVSHFATCPYADKHRRKK